MPTIPQYTSRERLTTEAPFVKKSAELEAQAGIGGFLKGAGELVSNVTAKFNELRDINQMSDARIFVAQKQSELEDKIDKADIWTADKELDNEIKRIGDEATSKITDIKAREQFRGQYDLHSIAFAQGIKDSIRKKQIDQSRVNTLRDLELEKGNYRYAVTEEGKVASVTNMRNIIDTQVKLGVFSAEDGYKLLNTTIKDAEEDIKKIKEANEKLVEKNKKILEENYKNQQKVNYKSAILEAFDGKLTVQAIQDLYRTDLINDAQRSKLENYIYYNLPTVEEDDLGVYNKIVEMQTEGENTPDEINNFILDNATKNKLKNTSAKQLIGKTYTDYKNRKNELIALNAKEMRAVATEFFRNDIDEPDTAKIETAIYSFNKRVQIENADGDRITQIAQEIMTDTIRKEYPEINNIETINKIKEMFGIPEEKQEELPPPKSETQELSPYPEYSDAFKENGVWKVIRKGQKYRIEE